MSKLTQAEAERLLSMIKRSLSNEVVFPSMGVKEKFNVLGETKRDLFEIHIFRGKINDKKHEYCARIDINECPLMELHINPSNVHINPNGEKIKGSHWHIYSEEHGRRFAFAAADINDGQFVENTIKFLDRFKVIEKPDILFQTELS